MLSVQCFIGMSIITSHNFLITQALYHNTYMCQPQSDISVCVKKLRESVKTGPLEKFTY